jgi:hypothetical protein
VYAAQFIVKSTGEEGVSLQGLALAVRSDACVWFKVGHLQKLVWQKLKALNGVVVFASA